MSWKTSLKKKYQVELDRQNKLKASPHLPESITNARRGGIVLLILGIIFSAINVYFWTQEGFTTKWLLACALAFLGLGLYALISGKMPKA